MSKWDWIHAGLEAATLVAAQNAQLTLSEMKTSNDIDRAKGALIEAIKNFVFDISRQIQLIEGQLADFPQQVYIVARTLETRLVNSGISAEVLPGFQDKQYFFDTEKKIAEVVGKSKEKLTPEQIQMSEQAVNDIIDIPVLKLAIRAKAAQESLMQTEKEWVELSTRNGNNQLFVFAGLFAIFLSCICLMAPIMPQSGSSGMVFLIGIVAFGGAIALIYKGRKSDPRYMSLKSTREELKTQLLPKEHWLPVVAVFGDLSSDEFKKIYEEKLAFLTPLLGEDFQNIF